MKTSLIALILLAGARLDGEDLGSVEAITSTDGVVIQARVLEVRTEDVRLLKDGQEFTVALARIEKHQALELRLRKWVTWSQDRFTGEARIQLKPKIEHHGVETQSIVAIGKDVGEAIVVLNFHQVVSDWQWLKYHRINMLVDGRHRWEFEDRPRTDVIAAGRLYEAVSVLFSKEQVQTFMEAKTVEIRIGGTEISYSPEEVEMLKMPIIRWQLEKKRQTPSTGGG